MGFVIYSCVMGGLAWLCYGLGRQDERLRNVCELCDDGNEALEHLGMCVECYEFYYDIE